MLPVMAETSIDFYNAAVDAIQAGRLDDALAAAESSLTEDPKDTESWRLYIMVLNALGRKDDARKATERLSQLGLGEADSFVLKASEAASCGDLPAAIAHYEAALATGDERSEIFCAYALALMEVGRADEARGAAEQAASLAPDDAGANYVCGRIRRLAGDRDGALEALGKAVAADPDLLPAVYERGMVLVEKDRLEEALEMFHRFLAARPDDPDAKRAVGIIRERMRPETR